jgi:hypothetical protein
MKDQSDTEKKRKEILLSEEGILEAPPGLVNTQEEEPSEAIREIKGRIAKAVFAQRVFEATRILSEMRIRIKVTTDLKSFPEKRIIGVDKDPERMQSTREEGFSTRWRMMIPAGHNGSTNEQVLRIIQLAARLNGAHHLEVAEGMDSDVKTIKITTKTIDHA